MADMYKCMPSQVVYIQDEYTAFCFNEACAYITQRIRNKEEPVFHKEYSSFSDFYRKLK